MGRLVHDPDRRPWPWDLGAIENALAVRGFRPERVVPTFRPFRDSPPYMLWAWCPGCYPPGGGSSWIEVTEPSLAVSAVLGPWCRVCDLPADLLLGAMGFEPPPPSSPPPLRPVARLGVRLMGRL